MLIDGTQCTDGPTTILTIAGSVALNVPSAPDFCPLSKSEVGSKPQGTALAVAGKHEPPGGDLDQQRLEGLLLIECAGRT